MIESGGSELAMLTVASLAFGWRRLVALVLALVAHARAHLQAWLSVGIVVAVALLIVATVTDSPRLERFGLAVGLALWIADRFGGQGRQR